MDNYEQKYKDALEKLQEALAPTEDGCKISGLTRGCIENIFPELKESKDDKNKRISKEITQFLKQNNGWNREWLTWLEKQGEQPTDKVEPKFKVGDIVQYITDSTDRRKIEEIDTLCNMYHTDSSPIMFEIEDEWKVVVNAEDVEQESVDKVEPKFKVGDWISGYYTNYKVTAINSKGYVVEDIDGNKINILFENEKFHHLWTIQDAKDGDVLASIDDNEILIFRHLDTSTSFSSYYNITGRGDFGWSNMCFIPATKEQRDLLFRKMADAGYEWDAETKELKKIESKTLDPDKVIEWLKHRELSCDDVVTTMIPDDSPTSVRHKVKWLSDEFIKQFKKDFGL